MNYELVQRNLAIISLADFCRRLLSPNFIAARIFFGEGSPILRFDLQVESEKDRESIKEIRGYFDAANNFFFDGTDYEFRESDIQVVISRATYIHLIGDWVPIYIRRDMRLSFESVKLF